MKRESDKNGKCGRALKAGGKCWGEAGRMDRGPDTFTRK